MRNVSIAVLAILTLSSVSAVAANADHSAMHDMTHHETSGWVPREGGQAAFAAIQEIVAKLEADPATDWSNVDIEALRRHLIDMNNVTLRAHAREEDIPAGVRFVITGQGDVVGSIRRMVFGHAQTMNGMGGWKYVPTKLADGASLAVTVADPRDVAEIKGLGFIGVLAKGSHHQMHHLMIATGRSPHASATPPAQGD